jgi:hypothetical protein
MPAEPWHGRTEPEAARGGTAGASAGICDGQTATKSV